MIIVRRGRCGSPRAPWHFYPRLLLGGFCSIHVHGRGSGNDGRGYNTFVSPISVKTRSLLKYSLGGTGGVGSAWA